MPAGNEMHIRMLTREDFDRLCLSLDEWWGAPVCHLLHPMFLEQFGDTA